MNFIHPELTPVATINEEPTYASIHRARTQLHDNAAAVFTSAGGGAHGHLALTMTAAEYLTIAKVAFQVPTNPTTAPVMVKASKMESTENVRLHEVAKKDFKLYHDVDKALRNQLIAATPDTYLQELRDPYLGYANISCLELITHLRDTYGVISQEDLDANQQRMNAKWHPPTPIEDLFEQLRAGAAFALEGGDILPPASVVRLGYTIILQTGLFDEACRSWRDKDQQDRTMVLFKKHFKKWEKDRRLMLTTGTAGYHGANHAGNIPPAPVEAPPVITEMEAMRTEMAAMRVALAAQAARPPAAPAIQPARPRPALADMGYCWTHGYSGNLTHTSQSCVTRAEGHQEKATHANQLGGNNRIWTRADGRTPR
jgi:hypothetical protein